MAAYSIGGTSVLSGGISTWKIMGEDWISLGNIKDANFVCTPQFEPDDYLRERPHGMLLEASAKIMSTSKTGVLPYLDKLAAIQKHDIALINGGFLNLNHVSTHTKWKFVLGGGAAQMRYIEIMVKRYYPLSNSGTSPYFEEIFSAAAQTATGTTPEVDWLNFAPTLATIWSSQCVNFSVRNSGETNWEIPSAIKGDPKIELELICPEDDQNGCYRHNNLVKATYEATFLATDRAGILLKLNDVMQSTSNDVKIDGIDGTLFTFLDNTGFVSTFQNVGAADKNQLVKCSGTGVIALASLDAVFA